VQKPFNKKSSHLWKRTFVVTKCRSILFYFQIFIITKTTKTFNKRDQLKANVLNKLLLNAFTGSLRPA